MTRTEVSLREHLDRVEKRVDRVYEMHGCVAVVTDSYLSADLAEDDADTEA